MNKIPVVKSKLTMPQIPASVVISERSKQLFNDTAKKNAVIITAPSGYGKTTLMMALLNYYNEINARICWYRMEQEDRDLSVFYAYLIEALFPNGDREWVETRQTLEDFSDYKTKYRYLNAIICQELWAYVNRNPNMKTFIAFDDFHNVMDTVEIAETITYLICNLPDNYIVIVSSRQQLELLTEKQKLEKNILEIDQSYLYFTEKEIAAFLSNAYQIKADNKLIHKIMSSTEGWIAGIIIICRMLSDLGIDKVDNIPEKSWQKTKLFSYMTSEVLKTVDKDMLQFLLKVATLKDFTVEEAKQILNINNAEVLISQCEKKGLFIQKVIREDITYRFHSLFRDTLREQQQKYMSIHEIKDLNLKAAAYYISLRIFDRAIEHFILCGDINSAVELITKESVTLITFEAIEQLRVWFNLLPDDVVEEKPSLLYIKSFTYQQGKDNQMIPLMEKALETFKKKDDMIMQVYALMTLIHYHMFANDINKLLDAIVSAMSLLNCIDNPKFEYMLQVLSFIRAFYEEEFSKAMELSKCLKYCEMDDDWKWVGQLHSCMLGYITGDFVFAEVSINEGFGNTLAKRGEFFRALALTHYCTVKYLKNEQELVFEAEKQLTQIGEKFDYNYMLGFGKRSAAYRKYAMHDVEGAVEYMKVSSQHFQQYGNLVMVALNKLCELLWLSGQESPEIMLKEGKISYDAIASVRAGFCLQEISKALFGAILAKGKDYKLAEEYLLAAEKASEQKGCKQILSGVCLHLSKLYFDLNLKEQAQYYLAKALQLASSSQYTMFWDIHLPTLTEILIYSIKYSIFAEYAENLIELYFRPETVIFINKNIHSLDEASIRGFSEVIQVKFSKEYNMDLSCRIDICLFGRFAIEVNGSPIPEDEWKTKKIKGILKYLVLHKGKSVTRELLMEIFWPNSDKKSAGASLRAALYELKKILTKYGIKNDEDTKFIHEKADILEIKPNEKLFIDTDEFQILYKEYKDKCKKGIDKRQLKIILERMTNIYTEDLLCEDIYAEWTYIERESYKSIFQEIVVALASLYIEQKDNNVAEKLLLKAISIDPYNEEACLMLLKLYVSQNKRSRAAKLYGDFEKRLRKELDIMPDERLSNIVKNISTGF